MAETTADSRLTTSIDIDPTWRSWSGVHGGYQAARAAAAGHALAPGLPLRAAHAMFTRPVTSATSQLTVEVIRRGATATTLAAQVVPEDRPEAALQMQMLHGVAGTGPVVDGPPAPDVPAAEQCEPFSLPLELVPFGQNVEIRPATAARPLAGGERAELVAWIRILPTGMTPAETFLVLPDALPPALYGVLASPLPIPTADLAVHLTADAHLAEPAAWYLVLIRTEAARDGWSLDASSVWNADGQLMALARQTRRVLKGA
ncbi:MAG: hypothetical protein QOJ03_489 [Frankiaceae bacterium]|nr:hypothetical protein [Frankiaceae bacterium]